MKERRGEDTAALPEKMNPIEQLQEDLTAMLLGNPDTAAVPFTSFRKQVIESAAEEAQAAWRVRVEGKTGLAALVQLPEVRAKYSNVPGPQYEVKVTVRLFEDPLNNNTGLSAEAAGLSVLKWADGLLIEDLTQLFADVSGPALSPNYDYPGVLVYDCAFAGQLPRQLTTRTASPTMDHALGVMTLGCVDAAAVLYFTTDGASPQPGDASGTGSTQVYSEPFAAAEGLVVRVVAWNPALLPSHVGKGVVKAD